MFQRDRPHNVFHMVVDLSKVLNFYSARCWEGDVALLTTQEEGRWASCS